MYCQESTGSVVDTLVIRNVDGLDHISKKHSLIANNFVRTKLISQAMPLTANQVTAFFRYIDQMVLSDCTRIHLQGEVILIPDDLIDFTSKNSWDQIVDNCKRPDRIPDPANFAQFIAQEALQLPGKSLMRLKVAAKDVEY